MVPERRPLLPPPHAEAVERGYVSYEDAKAFAAMSDVSPRLLPDWVDLIFAMILLTSPFWLALALALLVRWLYGC